MGGAEKQAKYELRKAFQVIPSIECFYFNLVTFLVELCDITTTGI